MKYKITKLAFVFLAMSVLTTTTTNGGGNKSKGIVNDAHMCLQAKKKFALNIECKKKLLLEEKAGGEFTEADSDIDIPISPISRFILLQ